MAVSSISLAIYGQMFLLAFDAIRMWVNHFCSALGFRRIVCVFVCVCVCVCVCACVLEDVVSAIAE